MKKIIFISFIIICFVSCEKEVFTGIVENNIYEYSKLFVNSNPNGYKIYIDDKNSASKTPDTIAWLTEGRHKLTLKHDIYIDSTINVDIQKSSVQNVSIDMLKNANFYSKVYCSTTPSGAKIYLNDQPTNLITPAIITNIFPGTCKIKFAKNQYRDDSIMIYIHGGEIKEVSKLLEDTSRTVNYRTTNSKISSNSLSKVIVDKFNNKWIGSLDQGLIKFDGKNWTSYNNSNVLSSNRVQDLLYDKKGRLWVGTYKGLTVFDGLSWKYFDDILPAADIRALEEDVYGNIWIATFDEIAVYNNSTFQIFNRNNTDMPLYDLSSIASSKNGDVWIGTNNGGVIQYSFGQWSLFETNQRPNLDGVSNRIKDLIVDNLGNIWIFHYAIASEGLESCLTYMSGSIWVFKQLPILFPLVISSFYIDEQNNLWMAITGGLIKHNAYNYSTTVYDSNTYGFFSNQSTSFCLDQNGDGWLTTLGGGITKLKKGNF